MKYNYAEIINKKSHHVCFYALPLPYIKRWISVDENFNKVWSNVVWTSLMLLFANIWKKDYNWWCQCPFLTFLTDKRNSSRHLFSLLNLEILGQVVLWILIMLTFAISIYHEFHDGMAAQENFSLFQLIYYSESVIVKIQSVTLTDKVIVCLSILLLQYNKNNTTKQPNIKESEDRTFNSFFGINWVTSVSVNIASSNINKTNN